MDILNIALNGVHSNLIGFLNRVPNAEVLSVLSDNNIGVGYPGDVFTVVQEGLLLLLLDIVQVELLALVSEEQLGATGVQLKVVDLGVVRNRGLDHVLGQVIDADGHNVHEVSDNLGGLAATELLLTVVQTSTDHVGVHVLSAAGTNDLIDTVLNDGKLTSVEYHADVGVAEVELLIA